MLKFLTHKLRNHKIDDDALINPALRQYKLDEERDSGTESDDEQADFEELPLVGMESELSVDRSSVSTLSPSIPSPYFLDSALASDSDVNNDHHSSEEELEVINASPKTTPSQVQLRQNASTRINGRCSTAARSASVNALPEKRKWAESVGGGGTVGAATTLEATLGRVQARVCLTPGLASSGGSSDDEVQGFLVMNAPVQFRTSPPVDVLKPGKSLSPPPKLFHYEVSPRKRHRHMPRPHHLQRPCLDFEKMQQLKARAVTAWRHNTDHGGELSVFCW